MPEKDFLYKKKSTLTLNESRIIMFKIKNI